LLSIHLRNLYISFMGSSKFPLAFWTRGLKRLPFFKCCGDAANLNVLSDNITKLLGSAAEDVWQLDFGDLPPSVEGENFLEITCKLACDCVKLQKVCFFLVFFKKNYLGQHLVAHNDQRHKLV
jgi:hypothetical protein